MAFDFCRPAQGQEHGGQELMRVTTPLRHSAWVEALASHPDRAFARYICDGIRDGFRIRFQRGAPLRSSQANIETADQHPDVVTRGIEEELARERMLGPFTDTTGLPPLQVSRVGVVPKGHNTGQWRCITDLSSPHGQSINDGIESSLCSMSYITVDDVASLAVEQGEGALLAKMDSLPPHSCAPTGPPPTGNTVARSDIHRPNAPLWTLLDGCPQA